MLELDPLARRETEEAAPAATATLLVAGDSTVDWLLYTAEAPGRVTPAYNGAPESLAGLNAQAGGAALLTALLTTLADETAAPVAVFGDILPAVAMRDPSYPHYARTWSLWSHFPRRQGDPEGVWRLQAFHGLTLALNAPGTPPLSGPTPTVLVLDDANLGFRDRPEQWPLALTTEHARPAQVLLKITAPLALGPLWQQLVAHQADRLTVFLVIDDLRKEDASVGPSFSWEQISHDLVRSVRAHPRLSEAARVVIAVGLAGAVIVEREGPATLVYDPRRQEGDWEHERPGTVLGTGTCIVAGLAWQAALAPEQPDWVDGVRRGLLVARALHEHGYELSGDPPLLSFPLEIAARLQAPADSRGFQAIPVPEDPRWTMLGQRDVASYPALALRILSEGPEVALPDAHVEAVGAWSSVDRTEIESLRSIRRLIRAYRAQRYPTRPLCLAVFGPAGASHDLVVRAMLGDDPAGGEAVPIVGFDCAGLSGPAELGEAFARVRDLAVGERLPLVIWEAFDTPLDGRPLGWLAHFLTPMAHGLYIERGRARPLGPAIFLFASDRQPTMERFKRFAVQNRESRATDFLSQIQGYVDVLGINPVDKEDSTYSLRRAFFLRGLLLERAPQFFHNGRLAAEPGLLRAFLQVSTYVHDARSLAAILDMCALDGKLRFERSCLPAVHQLGLHTNAAEFLQLLQEDLTTLDASW